MREARRPTHRGAASGGSFDGIQIHAAAGVHEYALHLVEAGKPAPAKVLDAGCGSGAFAERLAVAGYDVLAADFDIDGYAARPPAIEWDLAGGTVPADLVGAFDVACAVEVLEHVENPLQALRNLRAVLRPNGLLVVSTPNVAHPRSRLKFLVRGAPSYFGAAEYVDTGHRTLLPDWILRRHLEATGFTDIDVSFGGSFGLTGAAKVAYRLLEPAFTAFRIMPVPRVRDGCVSFASARRGE